MTLAARDVPRRLVRTEQDRLGQACLRRGQRARGGPAVRHQRQRTVIGVYIIAGLIYGIAAWQALGRCPTPTRTPTRRATWTRSPRSSSAAPACSAAGEACSARCRRADRHGAAQRADPGGHRRPYQNLATGVLVIAAVALDRFTRRERSDDRADPAGRGLVKRYGRVTAIDGADFDLLPGEVLAVVGDNGAGKSSLIKALTGAVVPDAGEINLDGQPVHFTSPAGRPPGRDRDGVPGPGRGAGAGHRHEPVPGPGNAARRLARAVCASWTPKAMRTEAQQAARRAGHQHQVDHAAGRDPVRRPAAGRRGGPGGHVRHQGRDHGRADGRAGRRRVRPRCWS